MGMFEDRYRQDKKTLTNPISLYKNEASAQQQIERFRGIGRYWMDMFMAQREMNSNVTKTEEANNFLFKADASELDPNMDRTGTLHAITEQFGWKQYYGKPERSNALFIIASRDDNGLIYSVKRTNPDGYFHQVPLGIVGIKEFEGMDGDD